MSNAQIMWACLFYMYTIHLSRRARDWELRGLRGSSPRRGDLNCGTRWEEEDKLGFTLFPWLLPQAPGLLPDNPVASPNWMEFKGLPSRSCPHGIRPSIFGWSGTFCRYVSNFSLNSSSVHFFIFLIAFGSELNKTGPFVWKLWLFKVCIDFLVLWFNLGRQHLLPRYSYAFASTIPGFGTNPWRTFQVYITLYRSSRRCSEFIFSYFNRSQ